jgi:hypothetical protein
MYTVWHVDKHKITFKLTNDKFQKSLSRPSILGLGPALKTHCSTATACSADTTQAVIPPQRLQPCLCIISGLRKSFLPLLLGLLSWQYMHWLLGYFNDYFHHRGLAAANIRTKTRKSRMIWRLYSDILLQRVRITTKVLFLFLCITPGMFMGTWRYNICCSFTLRSIYSRGRI